MKLNKKAQVSVEMIYCIGVIMLIFLILTGISFRYRSEVIDLDEYVEKRSECARITDYITQISAAGDQTQITITVKYPTTLLTQGVAYVGDLGTDDQEIEVPCSFMANITQPYTELEGEYTIKNVGGNIVIT